MWFKLWTVYKKGKKTAFLLFSQCIQNDFSLGLLKPPFYSEGL